MFEVRWMGFRDYRLYYNGDLVLLGSYRDEWEALEAARSIDPVAAEDLARCLGWV